MTSLQWTSSLKLGASLSQLKHHISCHSNTSPLMRTCFLISFLCIHLVVNHRFQFVLLAFRFLRQFVLESRLAWITNGMWDVSMWTVFAALHQWYVTKPFLHPKNYVLREHQEITLWRTSCNLEIPLKSWCWLVARDLWLEFFLSSQLGKIVTWKTVAALCVSALGDGGGTPDGNFEPNI